MYQLLCSMRNPVCHWHESVYTAKGLKGDSHYGNQDNYSVSKQRRRRIGSKSYTACVQTTYMKLGARDPKYIRTGRAKSTIYQQRLHPNRDPLRKGNVIVHFSGFTIHPKTAIYDESNRVTARYVRVRRMEPETAAGHASAPAGSWDVPSIATQASVVRLSYRQKSSAATYNVLRI